MIYQIHAFMMINISLICNTIYWIFHVHQLRFAYRIMKDRKAQLKTKEDVRLLIRQFVWKEDRLIDWQPWIITLFNKQFSDDCDGAANLGRWALEKVGIPARIVRLWKKGQRSGHSVCVSEDNKIMISNDEYVKLNAADYPQSVYDYFGNHFNIMT